MAPKDGSDSGYRPATALPERATIGRLFRRAANAIRQFAQSDRGSVAIYFGLSAIVFFGVAGLAVDAARGYLIKARLSEAVDAAALAGGKALQSATNNTLVVSDATSFFNANFPTGAMGATVAAPTINIINNGTEVQVASTATIPTTLMRLLGFQNMQVAASATVARAATGLDVVFSFDISGSMCSPCSKIQSLQSNAKALVDSLAQPFTNGLQQQIVTVNGTQYSLLNIGVVPWNSRVNVLTYPATTSGTVTSNSVTFADPMGRYSPPNLTKTYTAANSEVPLLYNPSAIAGGWSGCVYARYNDKDPNEQDDITLGTSATWPGWEPSAKNEGEPRSGGSCSQAYWNNKQAAPGAPIPNGWGNPPSPHSEECAVCPSVGILPLQSDTQKVKTMIDSLVAGGTTNDVQGLFWAYEVLMPGDPFSEAVVATPFQRAQAIVLMTDGQNFGGNGDAYHGWFGDDETAGTLASKGNMTMPDGSSAWNNLDNRLQALATKIKGANPLAAGAIKIYTIQYTDPDPTLQALLASVATQPNPPYYFYAPDPASLTDIFNQIGASLSALRIVQ
jgi:Flp pilus assembly protein TadG